MDCSICSTMPFILRPPRNAICADCYEGARSLIKFTNKLDNDKAGVGVDKSTNTSSSVSSPNSSKGFANALKLVKEMKDMEDELNEKLAFLGSFVTSFRHQIHTDIQIKPGNNGPPIPAHRALLAARSEIFKNILDSDGCKAPPNDLITLPELTYEELDSLLEFLYTGTLPKEKVEKHVYSLSVAADKYDIKFLQKFCEHRMLGSLNSSNALDVLEISDVCSNQGLKETALNFIVRNMEDVVFSARFDVFALKNPHLTVQITRASFMDIKNRRNGV
ncbi:BTB/POZ domain-containing protein [Actinidia chinensis var. chinensis]|uniref:BTB/POZ domain-containing protein n=1 Tax=Actinidia chinensis var. chinensis TaxID=1590841 RepID=A0A2R6PLN9_ACTCC|nr:BTB/POZ domain-containing protein [Actinidia chinensis var. chinensis]